MIKPGSVFYTITHDDDGKPCVEQWIVRTIRSGKITAIWKISSTWGKRSTKTGDYGWIDPVPQWCRRSWRVGTKPWGLFTTKRQAVQYDLKNTVPDDFDTPEQYERFISGLKRMRV